MWTRSELLEISAVAQGNSQVVLWLELHICAAWSRSALASVFSLFLADKLLDDSGTGR